jgi:genetic interactor of prohibitins 3, mitochondrial
MTIELRPVLRLIRTESYNARPSSSAVFRRPLSKRAHTVKVFSTSRQCGIDEPTTHTRLPLPVELAHTSVASPIRKLPTSCPGCGALSQTVKRDEAGYFSTSRGAVKQYLNSHLAPNSAEDEIFEAALQRIPAEFRNNLELDMTGASQADKPTPIPICDRCHNLIHHSSGAPIIHPTVEAIEATLAESPHKNNHIYHIMDAADFPMSLIPSIQRHVSLARLRTQNRRSKSHHYVKGQLAEMSFIITRSDLLAPKKEQVDTLMPKLIKILREALGSYGKTVRLGNLRCVSAKAGWWTKEVKESIWERGGGGWFVGKVNVGKSRLFEAVFPKGRNDLEVNFDEFRRLAQSFASKSGSEKRSTPKPSNGATKMPEEGETEATFSDAFSLLPPPQPSMQYPVMPIISELPGTTASPIRVPFGNGKGELIDLPGLARSSLEKYVVPEEKHQLVMNQRVVPERIIIKPGSSILLGGIIRITPTTPDLIFMAHAFVPLKPHLTSTDKAISIHTGPEESGVKTIVESNARTKMASAGKFLLKDDVTRRYSGPLTRKDAVGLKPERLPFIVYSTDILIEGCGWVELVAQVRRPKEIGTDALSGLEKGEPDVPQFPEVEVFSPKGRYIGQRETLSAWLLGGPKPKASNARKSRPRQSMRSVNARRPANK